MNPGCSLCPNQPASSFCLCLRTETLLCHNCLQSHYIAAPGRMHQVLPLQAYGPHRSPGYMMRLQRRSEAIEAGKAAFEGYLEAVNCCESKVVETVNKAIKLIWDYGEEVLVQLKKEKTVLKDDFALSVEETEKSLYEDFPYLKGKFSAWLREFDERFSAAIFSYKISTEEVQKSLQSLFSYQIFAKTSASQHQIVRLNENYLHLYDISTGNQRQIELSISIDPLIRYCPLSSSTLLTVKDTSALIINILTGEILELPKLPTSHKCPGLISTASEEGFVFGGETQYCERLGTDWNWRQMPNMSVIRRSFSPCLYNDQIYLPELAYSSDFEAFSLPQDCFYLLPFQLPNTFSKSVAFVAGDTLSIVTASGQLIEWSMLQETEFRVRSVSVGSKNRGETACPPLVCGTKVYWFAALGGDLVVFDTEVKGICGETVL